MPKTVGTARQYILQVLCDHPDRELQVHDLFTWQPVPRQHSKQNLNNTLARMLTEGLVVRYNEPNGHAYWAISAKGLPLNLR